MGRTRTNYKLMSGNKVSGTLKTKDVDTFVKENYGDILDKVVVDKKAGTIRINLTLMEAMERARRLDSEREAKKIEVTE